MARRNRFDVGVCVSTHAFQVGNEDWVKLTCGHRRWQTKRCHGKIIKVAGRGLYDVEWAPLAPQEPFVLELMGRLLKFERAKDSYGAEEDCGSNSDERSGSTSGDSSESELGEEEDESRAIEEEGEGSKEMPSLQSDKPNPSKEGFIRKSS